MGATGRDLHVDKLLSEMALGYRPEGFIADMIMPVVNVGKQSDLYAVFSRADRLRRQNTNRAPGTEARKVVESVGSGTYYAPNYALKAAVTIEDRANADPIYQNLQAEGKTMLVMDHLMLDYEIRVASQVTSTSNVGSSSAVSSGWTGSGADPLADINQGIDNVHYSNGVRPNKVTFGIEAWNSFRRHSTVRNLIFGTNNGGGYPNTAQVAQLLNVDEVQVAGAFRNTGGEGLAESLSSIWGESVLIHYSPKTPMKDRPSFAYSFRWAAPGLPNMQVERHPYNSKTKSEEVEVGYYQDEVITGNTYGFLFVAVNSST